MKVTAPARATIADVTAMYNLEQVRFGEVVDPALVRQVGVVASIGIVAPRESRERRGLASPVSIGLSAIGVETQEAARAVGLVTRWSGVEGLEPVFVQGVVGVEPGHRLVRSALPSAVPVVLDHDRDPIEVGNGSLDVVGTGARSEQNRRHPEALDAGDEVAPEEVETPGEPRAVEVAIGRVSVQPWDGEAGDDDVTHGLRAAWRSAPRVHCGSTAGASERHLWGGEGAYRPSSHGR